MNNINLFSFDKNKINQEAKAMFDKKMEKWESKIDPYAEKEANA